MKAIIRILFFVLCGLTASYLELVYRHNSFYIWSELSPKEIVSDIGDVFVITLFFVASLEVLFYVFKMCKKNEY